jgi:acetylornithine deacetylase/succinyl-diaminopimelate desuccinylase-like protein
MAGVLEEIDRYIVRNLPVFLADLKRLVHVSSVSPRGEGIEAAATLVAELLSDTGFAARIMTTAGFPIVYADARAHGKWTLICYNHYDVQPPEPLELWSSPPFVLTERSGRLYGRGVADDKGPLLSRIAAMRAVRAVMGELPALVKFLVEGEEEIGSISLGAFIRQNRELLTADACIWEMGGVDSQGNPSLILGMRGICSVEYRVRTMSRDAHSGGAHNLPNAAWRLIWALASIKGEDEHIRIPGFYDDVREPSEAEVQLLEQMPSDEPYTRAISGVSAFVGGHTGFGYKRAVYRPTANIAGLSAGWQGEGGKTVIPASARAKMDFRLVPDQDPEDIFAKLRRHLDMQGFGDVETFYLGGELAATTPPDDPFIQLAAKIAAEVYRRPVTLVPLMGGSGPMHLFRHYLRTPIVTLGASAPDVNIHAPNENISLQSFVLDTRHMAHLLVACGM